MRKKEPYILVDVRAGLIDSAHIYTNVADARATASEMWSDCNPEMDDIKVLGANTGIIYWMPPKD